MTIIEFFDIHKEEHLRAWKHLGDVGSWPRGFVPKGIEFPPSWQVAIIAKMADGWIARYLEIYDSLSKLNEKVEGDLPDGLISKDAKLDGTVKGMS